MLAVDTTAAMPSCPSDCVGIDRGGDSLRVGVFQRAIDDHVVRRKSVAGYQEQVVGITMYGALVIWPGID